MEADSKPVRRIEADSRDYHLGPRSEFILASDLGQAVDPCANALLERICYSTGEMMPEPGERPYATNWRAKLGLRFVVRGIETLRLGTSYYDVADKLAERAAETEQRGETTVLYDAGGARGAGEIIRARLPGAIAVTLTAGEQINWHSSRDVTLPKSAMVGGLYGALGARDLEVPQDLPGYEILSEQLLDLRRTVSALGRYQFNAKIGSHDDVITALGLALWFATLRRNFTGMVRVTGF